MRGLLLVITMGLAACGGEPPEPTEPAEAPDAVDPTRSATPTETVPPSATPEPSPIDEILPVELGGTELHTFATGRDLLGRLGAELDVLPDELEVDYASEHGERFLQMYAVRAPGASGAALLGAFEAAAYLPSTGEIEVSQETVGGRAVTVVHSDGEAAFVGTFYATTLGDTLLVVQAMERSIAEEALAALPAP